MGRSGETVAANPRRTTFAWLRRGKQGDVVQMVQRHGGVPSPESIELVNFDNGDAGRPVRPANNRGIGAG